MSASGAAGTPPRLASQRTPAEREEGGAGGLAGYAHGHEPHARRCPSPRALATPRRGRWYRRLNVGGGRRPGSCAAPGSGLRASARSSGPFRIPREGRSRTPHGPTVHDQRERAEAPALRRWRARVDVPRTLPCAKTTAHDVSRVRLETVRGERGRSRGRARGGVASASPPGSQRRIAGQRGMGVQRARLRPPWRRRRRQQRGLSLRATPGLYPTSP